LSIPATIYKVSVAKSKGEEVMSNNVAIRENVRYPDADISIKKNRIKKYGSNIYLKDGTEFEIELTNHSTKK
jgi:hypothetical protein